MTEEKVMAQEVNEEADFITLQFDDGEDVECEILGLFDFEGAEYIALLPDDGSDDDEDRQHTDTHIIKVGYKVCGVEGECGFRSCDCGDNLTVDAADGFNGISNSICDSIGGIHKQILK